MTQEREHIWQGYFDLSAAIVARAAKSCLIYCDGGFRATKNPHGAPEGNERAVESWGWLTGRGKAIRIEAELIYDCCDIDAARVLSKLWQQMVTIDEQRAHELEAAQTEETKYAFTRYAACNVERLSQPEGDQPESAGDVYAKPETVRIAEREASHPAIDAAT